MDEENRFGGWALGEEIGRGRNSRVYRAEREKSAAVLKVSEAKKHSSERYQRFVREIEAMRELAGDPGVMELIEAGVPEGEGQGEYPWYVMPEGVPLDRALAEASLEQVVRALASIAATLSRLHQRGYTHRDVKPQNLFVMAGEVYVLGDLGLISVPEELRQSLTAEGSMVGPANFIAPEMLEYDPQSVDARFADVYSLAKVLWALGSHERYPLPGHQRASDRRSLVAETGGDAGALDRLIEQATEHEPERRPSMNEMAAELERWLPREGAEDGGPDDLEAAVRAARSQLAGAHSAEASREQRNSECDQVFEALEAELAEIFAAVPKLGTSHVIASPQSPDATLDFPRGESLGGPQVLWSRDRYDQAMIGAEIDGVRLDLAISALFYDDGRLVLIVGIGVNELPLTLGPAPFHWSEQREPQLGTIEVGRAIEELGREGRGAMAQAIAKFAEAGKNVGE